MKIIIENENSQSSNLGDKKVSAPAAEYIIPQSNLIRQHLPRWCWVAIAQGLRAYYYQEATMQCQIASMILGFDCSAYPYDTLVNEQCNINYKLDKALETVGCYSHWSPGKPFFERVQYEINMGRPVCIRINWFKGDAHYVMINGYNADTREVYIQDPLHGEDQIKYSDFPSKYRLGGVWTETYWTIKQIINPKTINQ